MIFQLLATANNKLGPINAEKAFAAIHQVCQRRDQFGLHYAVLDQEAGLYLQFEKGLAKSILESLHASYPHADLVKQLDSLFRVEPTNRVSVAQLLLQRDLYSLKSYRDFEDLLDRQGRTVWSWTSNSTVVLSFQPFPKSTD